ncbi:uncharacterized protein LOC123546200 [Mercenaria mercenaria]|uniref:uncharacterized protein LOC123546200 n=1 Tax=Mercenaria mercenaria TaxID=6596 RepID=UPI00234EA30B|nr:uncharacterized protein LOC123546200 [Mercenaria mercenaria]
MRVDSAEMDLEGARSKILDLEKENLKMKDEVNYMKSQSMRNNLIFGNIEEEPAEKPARTEEIVRKFMVDKLKIVQDIVNNIRIERVHRTGITPVPQAPATGNGTRSEQNIRNGVAREEEIKSRRILCKFSFFGNREMVRGQSKNLRDTNYYVSEQFPSEIMAKRRQLIKRIKEEKKAGKHAWVSYDTLYVNGKPVKDV